MDLQLYVVRSAGKNPEKALNCPIWCLACYENEIYRYWWGRNGSEPDTKSPAGDREYILGLIGLGASVRYVDLTGTDKPGNSAFAAVEQDDIVVDGVSVRHLMEKKGRGAKMPSEAQIREKARELQTFVKQQLKDPGSPYIRPNAVGMLKALGDRRNRRYTVKL